MDRVDSKEERGHETDTRGHVQCVATRGVEQEDTGTVETNVGRVEHDTVQTKHPNC